MNATTTSADQTFTIVLDEDHELMAEGRLRRADAGPTWAKHRVKIVLDEGDTSGHSAGSTDLSISLRFEDDVAGHALSLHFPNAQKADEFRKRLLAGGIVAGALVVGVTAAQLSASVPATSVAAPAPIVVAGPAPVALPLTNPRIPAEDLAPAIPAANSVPIEQPLVNPRLPAEELAPAIPVANSVPIEQPLVNPRLPAEELAPVVSTATTGPALPTDPNTFRRGK
jgi:hypothetical protein